MNPKTFLHNTSFSVQLPYFPGPFKQNHNAGLSTKNLDSGMIIRNLCRLLF